MGSRKAIIKQIKNKHRNSDGNLRNTHVWATPVAFSMCFLFPKASVPSLVFFTFFYNDILVFVVVFVVFSCFLFSGPKSGGAAPGVQICVQKSRK